MLFTRKAATLGMASRLCFRIPAAGISGITSVGIVMFCGIFWCQAPAQSPIPDAWPLHLAGRAHRVSTDDYILYANDEDAAAELANWLDAKLGAFRRRYRIDLEGKGLVFAVESNEEPVEGMEEWRKRNIPDRRPVKWQSSAQWVRPYCPGDRPYFRESFVVPLEDAERIGILNNLPSTPKWVCFLTVDRYMTRAFDLTLKKLKEQYHQSRREVYGETPDTRCVFNCQDLIGQTCLFPTWREIDRELMRLQRRETLWHALIHCTWKDESRREEELETLRKEIDETWAVLYGLRPSVAD